MEGALVTISRCGGTPGSASGTPGGYSLGDELPPYPDDDSNDCELEDVLVDFRIDVRFYRLRDFYANWELRRLASDTVLEDSNRVFSLPLQNPNNDLEPDSEVAAKAAVLEHEYVLEETWDASLVSCNLEKIKVVTEPDELHYTMGSLNTYFAVVNKQVFGQAVLQSKIREAQDTSSCFKARWLLVLEKVEAIERHFVQASQQLTVAQLKVGHEKNGLRALEAPLSNSRSAIVSQASLAKDLHWFLDSSLQEGVVGLSMRVFNQVRAQASIFRGRMYEKCDTALTLARRRHEETRRIWNEGLDCARRLPERGGNNSFTSVGSLNSNSDRNVHDDESVNFC